MGLYKTKKLYYPTAISSSWIESERNHKTVTKVNGGLWHIHAQTYDTNDFVRTKIFSAINSK